MSDAHANNNASRNLRTVGSTHAPTRCAAQASNECIVTEGPRRQHLSPKVARWRGQIRSTCPRTADQKPVLWIGQRVQSSALRCSQPRILVSKSCSDSVCILGSEHVNATSHKFRGVPIKTRALTKEAQTRLAMYWATHGQVYRRSGIPPRSCQSLCTACRLQRQMLFGAAGSMEQTSPPSAPSPLTRGKNGVQKWGPNLRHPSRVSWSPHTVMAPEMGVQLRPLFWGPRQHHMTLVFGPRQPPALRGISPRQ
jgi:hypothetical protein